MIVCDLYSIIKRSCRNQEQTNEGDNVGSAMDMTTKPLNSLYEPVIRSIIKSSSISSVIKICIFGN